MTNNNEKCPIRVNPYGMKDRIPFCPEPFCSHLLLPDEKICPCHTSPVSKEKCDHDHCRCMNLDKQCPKKHYADCIKPSTIDEQEGWARKLHDWYLEATNQPEAEYNTPQHFKINYRNSSPATISHWWSKSEK